MPVNHISFYVETHNLTGRLLRQMLKVSIIDSAAVSYIYILHLEPLNLLYIHAYICICSAIWYQERIESKSVMQHSQDVHENNK